VRVDVAICIQPRDLAEGVGELDQPVVDLDGSAAGSVRDLGARAVDLVWCVAVCVVWCGVVCVVWCGVMCGAWCVVERVNR